MIKKLLTVFLIFFLVTQGAIAGSTPNKGYNNQTTGTNSGTWGIVLNQNFSTIDSNLGGTLTLSVAGSSNVTLSTAQAQNLIYNFTGVLTGNIEVIFPAAGGLYFINNATTGAYTLTVYAGSSTTSVLIPQGTQVPIYVDNSTNPPTVGGASGTQYVFSAPTVGGTANALTIASTLPSNFTLQTGAFLNFTPSNFNTGSATIQTPDGSVKTIQKVGSTGLINLEAADLAPGTPVIASYNGTVWIALNVIYYGSPVTESSGFSLSFGNLFQPIIATAPLTVTLPATTGFGPIFNCYILANGGAVTLTPNGSDDINGANSNFVIPAGSSGKLFNDGAGNWYIYFVNAPINNPTFTGTVTTPSVTFNSTSGIIGTATNNNAAAGSVGEYVTNTASSLATGSNTATNITSISLTAGDWDVWGVVGIQPGASTPVSQLSVWVGSASTTNPGIATPGVQTINASFNTGQGQSIFTGIHRFSLSTTTTIYLGVQVTFTAGSMTSGGTISARRVR